MTSRQLRRAVHALKSLSVLWCGVAQCERMVVLEQQVLAKMKSPFVLNLRVCCSIAFAVSQAVLV